MKRLAAFLLLPACIALGPDDVARRAEMGQCVPGSAGVVRSGPMHICASAQVLPPGDWAYAADLVQGLGDLNGDGKQEISISGVGRMVLLFGGPELSGPQEMFSSEPAEAGRLPFYEIDLDNHEAFHVMSPAGDADGDGAADLLLTEMNIFGTPGTLIVDIWSDEDWTAASGAQQLPLLRDSGDTQAPFVSPRTRPERDGALLLSTWFGPSEGAVYIFPPGFLADRVTQGALDATEWANEATMLDLDPTQQGWGSLVPAGDTDGDGRSDALLGLPFYEGHGAAWRIDGRDLEGAEAGARLDMTAQTLLWENLDGGALLTGSHVTPGGDLNQDGYEELLVGTLPDPQYAGEVRIFWGGEDSASTMTRIQADLDSDTVAQEFGYQMAAGGDLDGDGAHDLVVGAVDEAALMEARYVFLGADLQPGVPAHHTDAAATLTTPFSETGVTFNVHMSVLNLSDLNGDHIADLSMGTPRLDVGGTRESGGMYLVYGAQP